VYQLSDTFQGKFIDSIKRRLRKENLLSEFDAVLQQAWNKKWVVNCEPSLAKAEHVVKYLGQYTHRVAITNQRILNIDKSGVTFITKDYRDRALKKPVHMDGVEFLRRFCLHILPYRFVKIRRYGIYNPALKRNLKLQFVSNTEIGPLPAKKEKGKPKETVQERFLRLTGIDVYQCPFCKKGKMHVVKELPRVRSPDIFNISAQAVCSP
jgi:hypothetical protein